MTRTSCNAKTFHVVHKNKIASGKYTYKPIIQGGLYFWFTYEPTEFVGYYHKQGTLPCLCN